ncbi:MAG: excinuclease ABC subunit A, partial [Deltaproteobacteria bacterium]|nr:excinuclease ABC subunit A [Deltaproteobacteria bacterium]
MRDLSLRLPHEELVVISGVSGSGKSTLAFDTLYAEGARRYIETFSPYTRQFLDRLHQPDIDRIEGVRPALALEQKNRTTSSRSTVGTATELNDYLKVVWANIGVLHCPTCGTAVRHDTPPVIASELCERVSDGSKGTMFIAFRIVRSGDASLQSLYSTLLAEGFVRTLNEATWGVEKIEELVENAAQASVDELLVVVDRIPLDGAPLGAREKIFRSKLVQ